MIRAPCKVAQEPKGSEVVAMLWWRPPAPSINFEVAQGRLHRRVELQAVDILCLSSLVRLVAQMQF